MARWYSQSAFENEDDRRRARVLLVLVLASWVTYLIVGLISWRLRDWRTMSVMGAAIVLQVAPLSLMRPRYLQASAFVFVVTVLVALTGMATVGQGIRDLAVVAYPIVFVFAGLTLSRMWFAVCVGLTLAATCWLALGEAYGLFVAQPSFGGASNRIYLLGTMLVLLVGALAVHMLATNVRRSLGYARQELAQRKQAEEALRLEKAFADKLLDTPQDTVVLFDPATGKLIRWNKRFVEVSGYSDEELAVLDAPNALYGEDDLVKVKRYVSRTTTAGAGTAELGLVTKQGAIVPFEYSANIVETPDGTPLILAIGRDVTERVQAEEERHQLERQLHHSQKLESLGVLAGGIAHDFNNILTAVLGNAELALLSLSPSAPARENLLEISQASRRASALAHQMLAYSGRGSFVSEAIDLNALIKDMLDLLKSTISKKAHLDLDLKPGLPPLEGDPSQLSQVIMNLVINATEALEDKDGIIRIATGVRELSADYFHESYVDRELPSGLYLTLDISDTGCGMDSETRARLFEPFFTTKFTGRGLGLSAVLGIVRGHRGALRVYGEPGKGSTFRILFPAAGAEEGALPPKATARTESWRGKGTVLLVDDEEAIRALGARMLVSLGFTVVTAADGREALEIYRAYRDEIVLVLLDHTMPHMDGEETLPELRLLDPQVRVVMSSGYAESDIALRFAGEGPAGFLQKPYTLAELREGLQAALEGGESVSGHKEMPLT